MKLTNWRNLSRTGLVVLVATYLVATGNFAFFSKVAGTYPWDAGNAAFLLSVSLLHGALLVVLMAALGAVLSVRGVASGFILLAAVSGYFSDHFGTVIDTVMIQNIIETNSAEVTDLLNLKFLLRVFVLGVLPVIVVWYLPLQHAAYFRELRYRAQNIGGALVIMILCLLSFGNQYASFFREHKLLRYYANPSYPIYSMGKYLSHLGAEETPAELVRIFPEAAIPATDTERELTIMVVGETARRDRFSLNGYARETNPRLAKETNLFSFTHISSCGTSTAISVPCMFALHGHKSFDVEAARHTENILDVLTRAGVSVLWRDNNSDSKGVATRVQYEDFRSPDVNPECDTECRDIGMLHGLQAYIDSQPGDVLIVLHQMGNHGPAYFRRYPQAFERFTPACQSAELSTCTDEEIGNAYDNAILYTDYFLSEVIALLKANNKDFGTSMLYVSDHGESLGENGLYLHGMPYPLAPQQQIDVPVIVWVGSASEIDQTSALMRMDDVNSHDAVFDTLLSTFEVETAAHSGPQALYTVRELDE